MESHPGPLKDRISLAKQQNIQKNADDGIKTKPVRHEDPGNHQWASETGREKILCPDAPFSQALRRATQGKRAADVAH